MRKALYVLCVSVALAMGLCGCDRPEKDAAPSWQGYAEAEYVYVASPFGGRLMSLKTSRGSAVKAGEPLFQLDDRDEKALLSQGEALLAQARSTLDDMVKGRRPEEIEALDKIRLQAQASKELSDIEFKRQSALLKSNAIPVRDFDIANSSFLSNSAKLAETEMNLVIAKLGSREDQIKAQKSYADSLSANLDSLKWRLGQMGQAASASGRVFDTFYREGEYVSAGSPVLALIPPGNVKIRFFVRDAEAAKLKAGDKVLYSPSPSVAPKEASIDYISPEVEYTPPVIYSKESRAKLVFMVEARPLPADAASLNIGLPLDVKPLSWSQAR